jgi:hypothetical protein
MARARLRLGSFGFRDGADFGSASRSYQYRHDRHLRATLPVSGFVRGASRKEPQLGQRRLRMKDVC